MLYARDRKKFKITKQTVVILTEFEQFLESYISD
jgi:hypothetical protein